MYTCGCFTEFLKIIALVCAKVGALLQNSAKSGGSFRDPKVYACLRLFSAQRQSASTMIPGIEKKEVHFSRRRDHRHNKRQLTQILRFYNLLRIHQLSSLAHAVLLHLDPILLTRHEHIRISALCKPHLTSQYIVR